MNNQQFGYYTRLLQPPSSTVPDWFNFGVCAHRKVKKAIKTQIKRITMYRRHYSQDLDEPVHINITVQCSQEWLWPNYSNRPISNYTLHWVAIQTMLQEEFPEYKLTFSETPEIIKIETKDYSKTELGRSMLTKNTSLDMQDKLIGTLLGQAIGDALGTRYEFSNASAAKKGVERDSLPNGHLPILGGGPFQLLVGQITDDTELALMIARRMHTVSKDGLYNVASAFVDWYFSDPFDIGAATETALHGISRDSSKEEIYSKMSSNAQQNMDSLSNGCLMKISPIALFGILTGVEDCKIADFAADVCKLTNPNPIAQDACRVYVIAIRNAIRGDSRKKIWEKAIQCAQTDLIRQIITDSIEKAVPAVANNRNPVYPDGNSQGYLGVALQLAFFELLHGKSFEYSLIRTMTRGGDTDTNGCIVGALLGAFYGYSEIPADWYETVLRVNNPRIVQLPEVATNDLIELALELGNSV